MWGAPLVRNEFAKGFCTGVLGRTPPTSKLWHTGRNKWLPMYGKKVRLYHHGMHKQCNGCYEIGHMKRECQGQKLNWRGYVDQVRKTGKFEDVMFGTWIDTDVQMKETPGDEDAQAKKARELKSYLDDPAALKKALADYLDKKKRTRTPVKGPDTKRRSRSRSPDREHRGRSPRRGNFHWKRGGRYHSQYDRKYDDRSNGGNRGNDRDDRDDRNHKSWRGNRGGSRGKWKN